MTWYWWLACGVGVAVAGLALFAGITAWVLRNWDWM